MKKLNVFLIAMMVCLLFCGNVFAANEDQKLSDTFHEYNSVDTAPGVDGIATDPITIKGKTANGSPPFVIVSSSSTGTASGTITLQYWRTIDSAWVDYPTTYTTDFRILLYGGETSTRWRAIIKQGDFSGTGTILFGFGW